MATIKRFEDLEIWKMSAKLDVEVFKLVSGNSRISKDFRLRDQILGSSGSIMDNIAEGFERQGNREFIQFLSISKGSAGELRSQLHRCLHSEHIQAPEHKMFVEKCELICEHLNRFMSYLSKSEHKGVKFKK